MPFLPLFIQEIGVHDPNEVLSWTARIHAATAWAMGFSAPIWGILADRFGKRLMIIRSMFCASLVICFIALAQDVTWVFIARIAQGLLTGTITACLALTATLVPKEKVGFAMGIIQAAIFGGNTLGPALGGILADSFGFRPVFFIGAGLLFLGGVMVIFRVDKDGPQPILETSTEAPLTQKEIRESRRYFKNPFVIILFCYLILAFCRMSLIPMVPLLVQSLAPHSTRLATLSGAAIGLVGVMTILAGLLFGKLSDRFPPAQIILFCCAATCPFALGIGWVETLAPLYIWLGLVGFFSGGIDPALNNALAQSVPSEKKGVAFGLATTARCFGWGLAPFLASAAAAHWSIPVIGILSAGFFLLLGLTVWLFYGKFSEHLPPIPQIK